MTREEAKEFLLFIANKLGYIGVEDLTDRDGKRMIEAIKALEEPQWIPCSERLPQIGEKVFVADADGNMGMGRLAFDKKGNYIWSFQTCWNDFEDWTMWHPFPRPPRKEQ